MIPKNNSPSSPSELRNLSCTPLFSKILESFVLDRLRAEVKLSGGQYGGLKGCSAEHFLIESWDKIMHHLEDGDTAANLISVDFEKAFNRMDHFHCLDALSRMGANEETIGWVACFLYDRRMAVKINGTFSQPRTVPGGSPQGSILGNFLFCATTNKFATINPERPSVVRNMTDTNSSTSSSDVSSVALPTSTAITPPWAVSTPTARGQFANFAPPRSLMDLSGEYQSDEDDFQFFRIRNRM